MKVLTLHQPWAELVACGAKQIETRSWNTWYRGPLAIHASFDKKAWNGVDSQSKLPILQRLAKNTGMDWHMDYGAIIAVCDLVDCILFSSLSFIQPIDRQYWKCIENQEGKFESKIVLRATIPPAEPELSFGDYTPGRYAWILTNIRRLPEPIPAKGMRRLWEYEIPEEVINGNV